jgi:hypothetical protein
MPTIILTATKSGAFVVQTKHGRRVIQARTLAELASKLAEV